MALNRCRCWQLISKIQKFIHSTQPETRARQQAFVLPNSILTFFVHVFVSGTQYVYLINFHKIFKQRQKQFGAL